MKDALTESGRKAVRESVRQMLRVVGHDLEVSEVSHGFPGDAGEIYDHVDGLVRIVRKTPGDDVSKFLAQLPTEVCTGCRHQFENGFCPLRHRRMCALQVAALPVYEAIGGALRNLEDPEYCQTRDRTADGDEEQPATCACGGGGEGPCAACGATEFFG